MSWARQDLEQLRHRKEEVRHLLFKARNNNNNNNNNNTTGLSTTTTQTSTTCGVAACVSGECHRISEMYDNAHVRHDFQPQNQNFVHKAT